MRRARDRASRVDAHPERGLKPNIISLNSLYIQNTLYIASYVYISMTVSLAVVRDRVGPSRGRVAAPRSLYFEVRAEVRVDLDDPRLRVARAGRRLALAGAAPRNVSLSNSIPTRQSTDTRER